MRQVRPRSTAISSSTTSSAEICGRTRRVGTTLVWVLGFIPAFILGVVDYHGSRLLAFEHQGP